ncbi:hypothetical protein V8E55_008682 [Tylopilus felleus]
MPELLALRIAFSFGLGGATSHIDEAIVLDREALELRLSRRYNRLGAMTDLDEATVLEQEALPFTHKDTLIATWGNAGPGRVLAREALDLYPQGHPLRCTSLNILSNRLFQRYNQLGATQDLNDAILLSREVLALSPYGHPLRTTSLVSLANSLSYRYKRLGVMHDLEEAIVASTATPRSRA